VSEKAEKLRFFVHPRTLNPRSYCEVAHYRCTVLLLTILLQAVVTEVVSHTTANG